MRTVVVLDLPHCVAEKLKKGPEKPHRLGQITHGDRNVIDRAMKHTSSPASLLLSTKSPARMLDR